MADYFVSLKSAALDRNWPLLIAAALLALSLALFWPGIASYDTISQYQQVLSGIYNDWHPPVMARLWSLLSPLGPKTAPMLTLQLATYWFGLGLLAAGVGGRKALAILIVGILPPFLDWQGVVLKDGQMIGALMSATGLVSYWRLRGRPLPVAALIGVALCLAYATLVRTNAVFSSVPLAVLMAPRPRSFMGKAGAIAVATLAVLAVSPSINHHLLKASSSGLDTVEAIYDLSGIAVRTGDAASTGLSAPAIATLNSRRCVKPFFWDPLGDTARCETLVEPLDRQNSSTLYIRLAKAIIAHPVAYLQHRLAHLNSTERWLVPLHWPLASPPLLAEPNTLGLTGPSRSAVTWVQSTAFVFETPVGWPIAWVVVAMTGLVIALKQAPDGTRELAVALFISALMLEASFAVLSISSDLRYHLWPMLATALGCIVTYRRQSSHMVLVWGAIALAMIITAGLAARVWLPEPPTSYQDMLV